MPVWFGSLALILAAVGVYAVVAFSVSQRTREIGIRALGASRVALLRMFMLQGISILLAGLPPGLLASFAVGLGLLSILGETVTSNLVLPLLLTIAVVGSVALIATLVPARRAASIDPLQAIRYEQGS
jgi:ABC-type antimicrobial peptide transport system permease subunit